LNWIEDDRVFGHADQSFDEAIKHLVATPGAVLVSPRALEGVDLKADRSEFQIFIKLPHLFLGDQRTRRRKELLTNWYALQTATDLIQGCGRSVRTAGDVAATYVLDATFPNWLKIARSDRLLPEYFCDAVRDFQPSAFSKA